MSHITGGGLLENVPRTLPEHLKAVFEAARWTVPPIMDDLVKRGQLSEHERYRTLNMGIGYTLIVPFTDAAAAASAVPGARVIGWVETRGKDEPAVIVHPPRS
jgi:phosphoribosylformylglycinamidine cyclo-ligase